MKETFSYHVGESGFDRLLELFPAEQSRRAARREARKQNRQPRPWARPKS